MNFPAMVLLWMFSIIFVIQAVVASIAWRFKTDKLTDLTYGATFFLISRWLYLQISDQRLIPTLLVILLSIRSVRIGVYLFLRILAIGKDTRFDHIRTSRRSFIHFRILQAVVISLLLLPVAWTMQTSGETARYTRLGVLITAGGIALETIADRQKFRFKRQRPTRRCDIGLRRKARHPNYFGEMLVRQGVYLVCFSALEGRQMGVGLISPFAITRLLLFVTGIPPLERLHEYKRGDDKERQTYKKSTNLLWPFL